MGLFSSSKKNKFPWTLLTSINQLDEIKSASNDKGVVLFKHSTRCSISSAAMNRIESAVGEHSEDITYYYLDLISHREISNAIASEFGVQHESPQALVIKNGACVLHSSHMSINLKELEAAAS